MEHFDHAFATNWRAQHKVTVYLQQIYIEIRGAYGPGYSEGTDSNTAILIQLDFNTFVHFCAQFAIDNSTFGTENFQERLHWWGTASSC